MLVRTLYFNDDNKTIVVVTGNSIGALLRHEVAKQLSVFGLSYRYDIRTVRTLTEAGSHLQECTSVTRCLINADVYVDPKWVVPEVASKFPVLLRAVNNQALNELGNDSELIDVYHINKHISAVKDWLLNNHTISTDTVNYITDLANRKPNELSVSFTDQYITNEVILRGEKDEHR